MFRLRALAVGQTDDAGLVSFAQKHSLNRLIRRLLIIYYGSKPACSARGTILEYLNVASLL